MFCQFKSPITQTSDDESFENWSSDSYSISSDSTPDIEEKKKFESKTELKRSKLDSEERLVFPGNNINTPHPDHSLSRLVDNEQVETQTKNTDQGQDQEKKLVEKQEKKSLSGKVKKIRSSKIEEAGKKVGKSREDPEKKVKNAKTEIEKEASGQ